jgi:PAS domain S-box-containing protein
MASPDGRCQPGTRDGSGVQAPAGRTGGIRIPLTDLKGRFHSPAAGESRFFPASSALTRSMPRGRLPGVNGCVRCMLMRRFPLRAAVLPCLLFLMLPAPRLPAAAPRLLVLQSYHAGLEWSDNLMAGVLAEVGRQGTRVVTEVEYLDARRYPDPRLLSLSADLVEERLKRFGPTLIIACDNAALDFVVARRARSFPGVPVVFCGINSFRPSLVAGQAGMTGIPEEPSLEETILLALRLHPDTRRVVVVGRATVAADKANRDALAAVIPRLDLDQAVEFWDDLPVAALRQRLAGLGVGTVVFVNGLIQDEDGQQLMYGETTRLIRAAAGVPLYSFWDVYLGYGIVGGKLVSGRKQGELAASLALRVIAGENPERMPIVGAQDANQFLFDARELARFRIPRTRLPAGSVVLHEEITPAARYWWVLVVGLAFIIIQAAIIAGLVAAVRRLHAARKDLSEKEARLSLALSGADLGTWDWDVASGHALFDERWASMLGYTLEELAPSAQTWESLIHPEDRERVLAVLQQHLDGLLPDYQTELRMRHKTGSWVWVLAKGRVIQRDAAGRPVRACGTHLDITARRAEEEQRLELERRLLHAQKLESLGVLAGGIAHDFNNLLTAIIGNIDLARTEVGLQESLQALLDEAFRASQRAAELTRQMLAYSGKGRFVVRAVELGDLVAEISGLLRSSVGRNVTLELRSQPGLPAVYADAAQLQQVIMNLITNAAEALGGQPGRVVLATRMETAGEETLSHSRLDTKPPPGEYVALEVSDTGCGMSAETMRRLFDPFYSTKGTGRGLGMSAVLGIVKGHGGAIIVDSREGAGTAVKVLLPAAPERAAPEADAEGPAAPAVVGTGTVLIVDDEQSVRLLARRFLGSMGFHVVEAEDGKKALEIFREQGDRITFVLLDLTMPTMAGMAVLEKLRELKPEVKVILSSGFNQQDVIQRFAGKGLTGFVQKPYGLAAFREAVRRALAGGGQPAG